jgi:hypothetical protein
MPIREVCSPASSSFPNSKVSSGQPLTFRTRTTPGRADQQSQSPTKAHVSLGEGGGEIHVTGPKELPEKRPQERHNPEE